MAKRDLSYYKAKAAELKDLAAINEVACVALQTVIAVNDAWLIENHPKIYAEREAAALKKQLDFETQITLDNL